MSFRSLAALAAVCVLGCSNVTVSNQARLSPPISRYRVYSYAPASAEKAQSSENPAAEEMVQEAIDTDLDQRGIERALSAQTPDFLIRYKAKLRPRSGYGGLGLDYSQGGVQGDPYSQSLRPGAATRPGFVHDEADIEIDFMDAKTGKVFWSGQGTEVVNASALTPIEIHRIVGKILQHYPKA